MPVTEVRSGRTAAVMQPYFLPYLGYFQLLAAADVFVLYDTIKYTKKGWINRNRFLRNAEPAIFTLPLRGGADVALVRDRVIAPEFDPARMLAIWHGAYRRAPSFQPTMRLLEEVVTTGERNLLRFLDRSIRLVCDHLLIDTPIVMSSEVEGSPSGLTGQDRVIALCQALGADRYVNPIGGISLYEEAAFAAKGIELRYVSTHRYEYPQLGGAFVANLSIVDVLMFNGRDGTRQLVDRGFHLIRGVDA